jgi:hypothetical protein
LIIFDATTEVWTEVQPASASDKPVARYDMGFAARAGTGATGKIYLVGGKLSKWTTVNSQVCILENLSPTYEERWSIHYYFRSLS